MEIDDKGGEIVQRYDMKDMGEKLYHGGEIVQGCKRYENLQNVQRKEIRHGHGHGQRGSNIGEKRWIKILGQERHTSRGSKLMNFD